MSSKDPAFLFYSKDWLEGTAELMPEEKGIFIDLLSHQHQKKALPTDTKRLARLVGLSEDEFLKSWEILECKFILTDMGLINKKLNELMSERKEKGHKNTITGTFASLLRLGSYTKKEYNHLKNNFNVNDFKDIEKEKLTERLTEWLTNCLKSIGNANEDVNIIEIKDVIKEEVDNDYVIEIVNYLNSVCGSFYKHTTKNTRQLIKARIKEGFTINDFKVVIDKKFNEWNNTEMSKFLRPDTLFSNKFEGYLNQIINKGGKNERVAGINRNEFASYFTE